MMWIYDNKMITGFLASLFLTIGCIKHKNIQSDLKNTPKDTVTGENLKINAQCMQVFEDPINLNDVDPKTEPTIWLPMNLVSQESLDFCKLFNNSDQLYRPFRADSILDYLKRTSLNPLTNVQIPSNTRLVIYNPSEVPLFVPVERIRGLKLEGIISAESLKQARVRPNEFLVAIQSFEAELKKSACQNVEICHYHFDKTKSQFVNVFQDRQILFLSISTINDRSFSYEKYQILNDGTGLNLGSSEPSTRREHLEKLKTNFRRVCNEGRKSYGDKLFRVVEKMIMAQGQ